MNTLARLAGTVFYVLSIIKLSWNIMLAGGTLPDGEAVMTTAAQEVVRLVQRFLVQYS